ncbi:hypothetical protein C8T65DRAFT_48486 [Cerioporus squamosus]|nr:hypothetical protein C8T65DRAFT_48486 [Cerioporus squamosus]
MVPTFILTRTFAISALFVGAFPISYAAPIPNAASPSMVRLRFSGSAVCTNPPFQRFAARGCRQMGCLYALPTGSSDSSDDPTSSNITTTLSIPPGGFSQESMQVIDFLISALTAARSVTTDASASPTVDAVEHTDDAVKVDGFATAAIAAELEETASSVEASSPERRAESLPRVPEESTSELANELKAPSTIPRALAAGAAVVTVAREAVRALVRAALR